MCHLIVNRIIFSSCLPLPIQAGGYYRVMCVCLSTRLYVCPSCPRFSPLAQNTWQILVPGTIIDPRRSINPIDIMQYLWSCGVLTFLDYSSNGVWGTNWLTIQIRFSLNRDDVIKWKHFPRNWWRGALMFSLICTGINDWLSNREAGDLRRHRAHYDVTVMATINSIEDK